MKIHRKNSLALYFGAFLIAAAMIGSGAVRAADGAQLTKEEALKLQDDFQSAVVAADSAKLDKLMAGNCTFIHGNAMQQTKEQFMGMLTSGAMKVSEFKSHSQDVVPFHGGAIVISVIDWGMAPPHAAPNAAPMVLPMRISDVWVHTGAGWQLLLEQDTTLPQRAGMRPAVHAK
ncbi:MAG TPA: nuclear transport factor 2 family protein [Candidatus Dormibacteraeota bacterium]|nr:nuclear transport factor 2 family protein [Candidatus Dormibacteraeota bacterium]